MADLPPQGIEAYGGGGFRIAGVRHEGSILILQGVVQPWAARDVRTLTLADFAAVAPLGPLEVEVLLLGAGSATALAPKPVREALHAAGVGLNVMSTPEACRLYNYLSGEGRRVAAALIAV